ncbi:aspartate/glutamate racemase family protein [Candidatus Saccharibacteria bacterium]|nr:aspartate/glutamate racemase family protein [Candidatus Saccharibacteria bacterium]
MIIGVFDSGKGGKIVAERLRKIFPEHQFLVVDDHKHLPYGNKTAKEITELTSAAIQPLLTQAKIIIIACNTATAAAIDYLREKYPKHQFIGFEPAIKPAVSETKAAKIMVLATPATLKSTKYLTLKKRFAADVTVVEPDCSTWAEKIENDKFDEIIDLAPVINAARCEKVDEVVLGCTHYLAIENDLRKKLSPNIKIIEPIAAVARRLDEIIHGLC